MSSFKFHYCVGGNATGFLASKGAVKEEGLELAGHLVPYETIRDTTVRDRSLVLTFSAGETRLPAEVAKKVESQFLVMIISGMTARNLERLIDRRASSGEVERVRQQLQEQGEGHLFRVVSCPHCQAQINLSGTPETAFTYCRYCDSLFGPGLAAVRSTHELRACDECGFYDRVQGYGEFYFYFLLFVYGFRHGRRHYCDGCGAALANKLLLYNALFILGVPNALVCAVRARAGKAEQFRPLARANKLAKKGKLDQADELYQKILKMVPGHPGVLFNQAMARALQGQLEPAVGHLSDCLDRCPNYLPAQRLAHKMGLYDN
ncbi:MAG: hypothetical protein J0I12_10450 [Candidatus Eremiobacteraeota bacterium]|nr:hypothetical protein [Candidatus Eremiobacteraeota bacterium]